MYDNDFTLHFTSAPCKRYNVMMKRNLLLSMTSILFFFGAQANISAAAVVMTGELKGTLTNAITEIEEKKVLLLLNNFCGDAWCEGTYDIQFKSIQFDPSDKAYVLAAATTADSSDESTATSIPFHCEIADAQIIVDTLKSAGDEELYQAERRLFQIISGCIDTALYVKQ